MMTLTRIQAVEKLTRGIPNHVKDDTWVGPRKKVPYLLFFYFLLFFTDCDFNYGL